ncbi:hypothetical protein [Arenibaculum pallidiluteum]|uniref:hypothetical protein n=1 Tax=Arenibaculum pallidiluteum TaxID=2812559 RepID=UPI001A95A1EC|nr:hypothetical protein [Arenibaculum pallidiluteum]
MSIPARLHILSIVVATALPALLAGPAPVAAPAADGGRPREFVMPPAGPAGEPPPRAAPRARVETSMPGADAAADQPFAIACTAEEAALIEPRGNAPRAAPRCPEGAFTVLAEEP